MPNAGGYDAFVSKYDADGKLEWTRQFGTSADDESTGVSADGLGSVYVSGYTAGSLETANTGGSNAFVRKYDSAGNVIWTRQLESSEWSKSTSVSADRLGNVYIAGYTHGALAGPNAGGFDAFVSRYDAAGNLLWTRRSGSSASQLSFGVSADGLGYVYISGYRFGSLDENSFGRVDSFVSKYDAQGNIVWTKYLGGGLWTESTSVSADGRGNAYVSGRTEDLLGASHAGGFDAFVSKYNAAGNLLWTQQIGTADADSSEGVSADQFGNVYIAGATIGSLGGPNVAGYDAFLIKLVPAAGMLAWLFVPGSIATLVGLRFLLGRFR